MWLVAATVKKVRFDLEQFIVKNIIAGILFLILRSLFFKVESSQYFDNVWNAVIGRGTASSADILMYCIGYLFMIDGGTAIVKGTLKKFPGLTQKALNAISTGSAASKTEKENTGEIIGIIERLLILTFILAGNYEAVGFAVAAKSIARFKELDDKNFAEYYLLGTSVSVGIAVAAGVLLRAIVA